jgi:hypothetical protein
MTRPHFYWTSNSQSVRKWTKDSILDLILVIAESDPDSMPPDSMPNEYWAISGQ